MVDLIGGGPAAGFDDPIGMLYACHSRIRKQLDTLSRLSAHVARHGADEVACQAARSVMRYFDTAGPHHHADEEQDVFPLMQRWANRTPAAPGALRLRETLLRLEQEHVRMEAAWQALRVALVALCEGKSGDLPGHLLEEFRALYTVHMSVEEEEVFAMAGMCIAPAQLAAIGRAMAERRGVRLPAGLAQNA